MTPIRTPRPTDRGFTLIELLVVIIIIGILAAIAVPIFMGQRKRAADSAATADIRNIAHQLETYYVTNLTYPLALNGVTQTSAFAIGDETSPVTPGVSAHIVIGTGTSNGHYAICAWTPAGTATNVNNAWVFNSARGGKINQPEACPAADSLLAP